MKPYYLLHDASGRFPKSKPNRVVTAKSSSMGGSYDAPGSAWAELPADILVTVFEGLAIPDLFRAGAVCRCWNAASSYVRGLHHVLSRPAAAPCLLYAAASSSGDDPGPATLYSVTDGRSYAVPLRAGPTIAGSAGSFWLGASHGWLVTIDEHAELHLVNPVTGQRIDSLPSVATIEHVRVVHDGGAVVPDTYRVYEYDWSLDVIEAAAQERHVWDAYKLANYLYLRVLISSDPSDGSDCVVVLIHRPRSQLSFARLGDAHWTWIQTPTDNTEYCDCAFDGDGRTLFAMRHDGAIHAFDLHGEPALVREIVLRCPQLPVKYRETTNYLVHAPWLGGWLQVWRTMDSTDNAAAMAAWTAGEPYEDVWTTKSIIVYQVDLAAQKLVEIKNLGDHALFVGCNYSFSLAAADCPGVLPNHIYYTDNEEYYAFYKPQCPRDIGVYNVRDGSFQCIQPPCPWLNWPLPSWITPSFGHKRE
ncbi:hypothetical protein ACP4OV_013458 [Aristida adscensionis]